MSGPGTAGVDTAPDPGGPRLLVAPVTVSPTKPLTPTHLKYLLSLDMLYRATATFADPTFLYHHGSYAGSQQIAGFWAYLEQAHPELSCERLSEEAIGELYAAYHSTEHDTGASIKPMARRAEAGWTHPVSARLLDLWQDHYRLLGMFDPELGRAGPDLAGPDETIDLLRDRNLCIDGRELQAPVYLDATPAGLPLRPVLHPDGQPNYLLYALRELVPLLGEHDQVVLAHDTELRADYRTIAHVLSTLGGHVTRFEVPRVPLDGVAQSTRRGGWHGYTLTAFAGPLLDEFGPAAFRLGLRLYLVAGLGRTARQSFSVQHLRRWARRARRLLNENGGCPPAGESERRAVGRYLAPRAGQRGYADPYQLTTALMSRDRDIPTAGLLRVLVG